MSSGPDDRSTATIKFGDKFDAPWFVAGGNPDQLKRQLLEFAGLTDQGKTLQQLMVEIATETQAMWAVRSKVGGQQLDTGRASVAEATPAASAAPAKAEEDPHAFLLEAIADAASLAELTKVFLKNKEAFNTTKALQAAFSGRKTALS